MVLFIVLLVLFILMVLFIADYSSHIYMIKGENLQYDWCNFKTFLSEFNLRFNKEFAECNSPRGSIFVRLWDSQNEKLIYKIYLHAGIIRFDDDKCMILYPWSYFKYCKWLKGFDESKRVKGLYDTIK